MEMGRVRGNVVLNAAIPALRGKKLRVVEEVDALEPDKPGKLIVTFDAVGAGEGELVFYEGGPESSMAFLPDLIGSDAAILGIVDHINTAG